MPKEKFTAADAQAMEDLGASSTELYVTWGRAPTGTVEIGTEVQIDVTYEIVLEALRGMSGRPEFAHLGQGQALDDLADVLTQETGIHKGWWINLDRVTLNRLIRTLRKARDAAYGRDA